MNILRMNPRTTPRAALVLGVGLVTQAAVAQALQPIRPLDAGGTITYRPPWPRSGPALPVSARGRCQESLRRPSALGGVSTTIGPPFRLIHASAYTVSQSALRTKDLESIIDSVMSIE